MSKAMLCTGRTVIRTPNDEAPQWRNQHSLSLAVFLNHMSASRTQPYVLLFWSTSFERLFSGSDIQGRRLDSTLMDLDPNITVIYVRSSRTFLLTYLWTLLRHFHISYQAFFASTLKAVCLFRLACVINLIPSFFISNALSALARKVASFGSSLHISCFFPPGWNFRCALSRMLGLANVKCSLVPADGFNTAE